MDEISIKKRARKFRIIGYAIFGGIVLYFIVVMLMSVISAITHDRVIDPFTNKRTSEVVASCIEMDNVVNELEENSIRRNLLKRSQEFVCRGLEE